MWPSHTATRNGVWQGRRPYPPHTVSSPRAPLGRGPPETTVCDWPARDALLGPMMTALRERVAAGDVTPAIRPSGGSVYVDVFPVRKFGMSYLICPSHQFCLCLFCLLCYFFFNIFHCFVYYLLILLIFTLQTNCIPQILSSIHGFSKKGANRQIQTKSTAHSFHVERKPITHICSDTFHNHWQVEHKDPHVHVGGKPRNSFLTLSFLFLTLSFLNLIIQSLRFVSISTTHQNDN